MNDKIDCLLIGHNEMNFEDYEAAVRQMGTDSGAYRDLNLNFIKQDNKPYSITDIFNEVFSSQGEKRTSGRSREISDYFSATIAYLGSYLAGNGLTFDFVHSYQDEKEQLKEKLKRENILVVAITTTFYVAVLPILEIIDFIKSWNKTAKIVLGGPFVLNQVHNQSAAELKFLFTDIIGADFYVYSSQGEETLINIIRSLKNCSPIHHIRNIYYKTGTGLLSTSFEEEGNKLSSNMVNWGLFSDRLGEYAMIRTAISCPFSCSFCSYPEYAGTFQSAGAAEIEQELNSLKRVEKTKYLYFINDTINVPVKGFKEILRMMIKNKYGFKWHAYFRCQYADEEMVALMKESGCIGVYLGLESGSNRVLANMNKGVKVEDYYKGVELLKKHGIITHGSFIIGFPGETLDTVRDTVGFIEECGLDFYRAQLWYCSPVTPIYKEREKYDLQGMSFDWSHATMDVKTACDQVEDVFLKVKESVSVPTYNFDFHNLLKYIYPGMNIGSVRTLVKMFNKGIEQKLRNPARQEVDPGFFTPHAWGSV